MAEPRRIPLDTVKSLAKEKKLKDQPPTQRFCLTLDESNDKTCPEYSYSDLLKTAREEKKEPVREDPFGDDDDDDDKLKELARKFEEKYGPKIGKKKRKKFGKWEDYIDRGMGYDETDPFIDNDEAYDELVPSTLTTQYGGFYINSGELEFRVVTDSDSEGFPDEPKPRRKRRRLIEKDGRRRKRLLKEGEHVPKKRGRRPLDKSFSALHLPRKKKQPTVAVLLQQHKSQQSEQVIPVNENSFQSENGEECGEDGNVKSQINVNEVIESVVKASGDNKVNNGNAIMTTGSSDSDEHIRLAIEAINAPKLPDNLPSDLETIIKKLKQHAYVSDEGKCKFFSGDVNKMLLSVELKSRELPCNQRSTIFSHLASHLPCTKETLLKRAKKLRIDQEMEKLREPLRKLKEGIGKLLPNFIEKYVSDLKAAENKLNTETEKEEGVKEDRDNNQNSEEKSTLPQKEFEWNDEMRQLLCDLVHAKMRWYETSKARNQTVEEYLWQFLELEVKNLWPAGWMKTKNLYKESRDAHSYMTNKPKKPMLSLKKPSTPLGIQVSPIPLMGHLPSNVVLSPIATGQELAEGMSNIKVPTTSGDEGESLGTLIAVTTANSALPEERKPHVLSEPSPVLPSRTVSVVTSSVQLQQKESVSSVVSAKSVITTPDVKPTGQIVHEKPSISLSQVGSPNKRIFTLINSGDAAQLQAQQVSQQTSLASQMLDRIICASLANFPNSGSSTNEAGRYNSKTLNVSRDQNIIEPSVRPSPKSGLEGTQPKVDCLPVKPPSPAKMDTQVGSPSNLVRSGAVGVSILKSSYQAPTEQRQIIGRTSTLPEQTKGLTTPMASSQSASSARKFQMSPVVTNSSNTAVNARKTDELKMPFHTYEFLEAFKRTLENSPEPLQPRNEPAVGHSNSKVKTSIVENSRDEPANFKKLHSPVDSASSLVPQDFSAKQDNPTVVHLSNAYKRPNQQMRSMQLTNSLRVQRSSPETVSTPVSFPEGMKGFPLPIKSSQSTNPSCISSLSTASPAHSLGVRTSPAQTHEPGFASPHRHNSPSPHRSVSAHSPSHGHPSSAGNSASHSPYQSTPLSHFPPVEAAHNRPMLQNQWRASSPSTTATFPSQYSTSNPSPITSSPTSQAYQSTSQNPSTHHHHHHHHHSVRSTGSAVSQGGGYSHNISPQLTPAHSSSHKTVDSHPYSQSNILPNRHSLNATWQQNPNRTASSTQSYSNSAIVGPQGNEFAGQSMMGHHTENSYTTVTQQLLTPFPSFPLSSHSGTTPQTSHHRVP